MSYGFRTLAPLVLASVLTACGGVSVSTGGNNGATGGGGTTTAAVQHVVVVVLENQNYSDVVGSSAMPYWNSLASQNSMATQFYANAHPSIGNYFELTTAQNPTGNIDAWPLTFGGDNIARELTAQGKTWKVYAQSLPAQGYVGDDQYPYVKHHNPFAYFDEVINSATQKANIVSSSQFAADIGSGALPTYSFVIPDDLHNGHDCPNGAVSCLLSDRLSAADNWLSSNLSPLIQNSTLMANTVVIVTFDESSSDNTNGGGRVPVIFAGAKIKNGFQSTAMYQFPSVLRFSLQSVGVASYPGNAASAPAMTEFLK
jgi:phosphatidylinositol-3-phosphatase